MIQSTPAANFVMGGSPPELETSRAVTTVFEDILAAINDGRLLPGQRLNDGQLAEQFGVSRTPVREALQRLREIGIVEASASRFTRVALVSPAQTKQAMIVWLALYGALIEEVIPHSPEGLHAAMQQEHNDFAAHVAAEDIRGLAAANLTFFTLLASISTNDALRRAITSVVHIVRLGSLHLPGWLDFAAIHRSQQLMLRAVEEREVDFAREALVLLRGVDIPQEPTTPDA